MWVGRIESHQDGIEVETVQSLNQNGRIIVAGDTQEPDYFLIPGFLQGLDGTILTKDLVEIFLGSDIVKLPQVEVVGLERRQALFQELERTVSRAVTGLGGQEHLFAPRRHDLPDVLLADPSPVSGSIDVIDAQIDGTIDDGDRLVACSFFLESRLNLGLKLEHFARTSAPSRMLTVGFGQCARALSAERTTEG